MRQVIEGKVFDTSTAQLIHEWSSGHYAGDFHRQEEALYRTRGGVYFLHGEGGALSPWSVAVGDRRSGGERIIPMTAEEALEWAEEHGAPAKVIEATFDVVEA